MYVNFVKGKLFSVLCLFFFILVELSVLLNLRVFKLNLVIVFLFLEVMFILVIMKGYLRDSDGVYVKSKFL